MDPIVTALLAFQTAQQTVDTDQTNLSQAELAAQGAQATVSQLQTQLTTDKAAAQSAFDAVVSAGVAAGYAVNVPPAPPST